MVNWRLLDLGAVDGYTMTNLYEAVAHAVSSGEAPNTIILDHPESPFVNIGYHQLMKKEINVEYARKMGFALVRRTIGGGAILDGPWEQDYFAVINRSSPECPRTIPEFYGAFMKPALYALKKLGLDPVIRQPNDILVDGKRISGNGAISIEKANVLAGDLLIDSPTHLMSEIINAPSEKFRDKLAKSMKEWITSIKDQVGEEVPRSRIKELIVEGFTVELGINPVRGELTEGEREHLETLITERKSDDWIFSKDNDVLLKMKQGSVGTKIHGGVVVSEATYKAGKMIRILLVSKENTIEDLSISGDFFTQPYTGAVKKLESSLKGTRLVREELAAKMREAFDAIGLRVMGATQEDFVKAILKARHETG